MTDKPLSRSQQSSLSELMSAYTDALTDACDDQMPGAASQAAMRRADGIRAEIERRFTPSETREHSITQAAGESAVDRENSPTGMESSREGERPSPFSSDKHDEADRLVSITVGGSTHVRTAGEWLALARASLSHGGERSGCPCTVEGIEPCSYACSCAHPFMSGGCQRCAAYGSLEQRQAAARRLISSATTRGPWPLDTLIGRALDDLYRAYGIDFPRTNSDLRRCFSVAEKYLAATESRNTR
jgi:hypothetical protein